MFSSICRLSSRILWHNVSCVCVCVWSERQRKKKSLCLYQVGNCICMWMTSNFFSPSIICRYIYIYIGLSLSFPDWMMLLISPLRCYQLPGDWTNPHLYVVKEHIWRWSWNGKDACYTLFRNNFRFFPFSLSHKTDTAHTYTFLMIDGAQQETWVILHQVALNTPESYRNVYVYMMLCLLCLF